MSLPAYFWDIDVSWRFIAACACSRVFKLEQRLFGPVYGDGVFYMLTNQEKLDFISMYCAGGEL